MARRNTGLSDDDVDQLRAALQSGRRPRVRVAGVQFPDGTTGTVLRVGDPGQDGAEFVTVRLKVDGITDELGFSPKELARTGKGTPSAPRAVSRPQPAQRRRVAATTASRAPRTATAAPSSKPAADPAGPPPAGPARRRAPAVAPVTITIASSGSSWSVTAQRGARVAAKKVAVTPGAVAAIAALLGQPAVEEAVAAVNDTARGEAEARAEKLRAELAEVEAVLVSHRRP